MRLAQVVRHAAAAQHRAGRAVVHGVLGADHAQADGALPEDGVLGEQQLVLVDEPGERSVELVGHVGEQAAHADERRVHAHTADQLVDVEQLLAVAPRVDEGRGGAQVEGARAVPDQVAGDAAQLAHDHAQVLRPWRDVDTEQPLHSQREAEVVEQRRQVVHAVRVRDALLVVVPLEVLLEAGVQVPDVGPALAHHLAVEVEHQAQHAVRRRVLRTHVELHGLLVQLHQVHCVEPVLDAEDVAAVLVLLGDGVARRRRARRWQRGHRVSPGMSRGRSCAGNAHSRLCVNATGSPNDA